MTTATATKLETTPNGSAEAELARLRAENAVLQARLASQAVMRFKIGDKGGVSVYGLNARFPVTLYEGQWRKLAAAMPSLIAFCDEHAAELSHK